MNPDPYRIINLVVVGDVGVGKTALSSVFVNDHFCDLICAGPNYLKKTLDIPKVILQIWDMPGVERFRNMLTSYIRRAECAVFVYDVTARGTFLSVCNNWIDYINQIRPENIVKVLVASKSDMEERAVEESEGRQLAELHNMLFFETSARHKINVDKMFTDAVEAVLKTIPRSVKQKKEGAHLEVLGNIKQKCCVS